MGILDFFKGKYDNNVASKREKNLSLSVQYNAEQDNGREISEVKNLKNDSSVNFSDASRSSENLSYLTNEQFHMHTEHGSPNGTLPDLHLIDNTNGKATFFLNRCYTTEEQAKEAAKQVMKDYQVECPNVLFFKDSAVINRQIENKLFNS